MTPQYHPQRGHYCPYEQRGEKCPGCSCSHEATPEELANPCNKSGVRDGVRCSKCGRWAETPEHINHASGACVPVPRGRR